MLDCPRDIRPGSRYPAEITKGIENCKIFIFILSENSNSSRHTTNEVEIAHSIEKPIFPVKISDIDMKKINKELRYFLGTPQWQNVTEPDRKNKIIYLAELVKVSMNDQNFDKITVQRTTVQKVPSITKLKTPVFIRLPLH